MKIYRYLKSGIRNLVYWFPIIWKDQNWDHYYLTAILRHKLNDMQKFYAGPNAWSMEVSSEAEKMKMCVTILDRLLENDYNKEGFDAHDEKWGELTFDRESENDKIILRRTKRITEEDEEVERKQFQKVFEDEEKLRNVDIANLFTIMKENLLRWWD